MAFKENHVFLLKNPSFFRFHSSWNHGCIISLYSPTKEDSKWGLPTHAFLFAPWTPELPQESKSVRLRMFIIFHPYTPPTLKDKNTFRNFWGGWATFLRKMVAQILTFQSQTFWWASPPLLVAPDDVTLRDGKEVAYVEIDPEIWDCLETNFWNWWLVELSGEELVERLVEHCLIWRIQALMQLLIYLLQIWNSLLVHTVDGDPA